MEPDQYICVTRGLPRNSLFRKWCEARSFRLLDKAFICTEAVEGLTIPDTDWIFFSSPQSVHMYFSEYKLKAKKVAALSKGTWRALEKIGCHAEFVGDTGKNPEEIGTDFFRQIPASESVFFPLSSISRRTVSACSSNHQVYEMVVYRTSLSEFELGVVPALIIFTSPSNVDGFLLKNTLVPTSKIVAIGETTRSHLTDKGIDGVYVPDSTEEASWIKLAEALLG